jgi:hypothetical protein
LLSASACLVLEPEPEPANDDGDYCATDADCANGRCNENHLCAHTACDCPGETCDPAGEAARQCREGWLCVGYDSILDPVGEFFGAEPDEDDGYCQAPCSIGCPEHYICRGTLCAADPYWHHPAVSVAWSGGAEGSTGAASHTIRIERGLSLAFVASATSPIDAEIESYTWTLIHSRGEQTEHTGPSLELRVDEPDGVVRVELVARDGEWNSDRLDIQFDTCSGTGQTCGYQGSGCCVDCDDATDTCL